MATLIVGVSGTLAALSDTLFPATSLRAALAQDFSPAAAGCCACGFFILSPRSSPAFLSAGCCCAASRPLERKLALLVLALLALQFGLGVADVALLAPVWLQIVHLLGADLLWIALVVLAARVCVVDSTQALG